MKIITELQQRTLFDLDAFAIEQVLLSESIGDWDWESVGIELLPNFKSREQHSKTLLPTFREHPPPSSSIVVNASAFTAIDEPVPDQGHNLELLPKSREQSPKKLLPNREIREQLQMGQTVIGYSIVPVKGNWYYLTHSQSNKYYPTDKGWSDIKAKAGINYLYTRWRDSQGKQKSRCMGRVDRVE